MKPSTTIRWEKSSKLYNPSKPFITWKIVDGKLLLDGRDQTPCYPISKADLEASLQRMKDEIAKSGHPITIEAIYIEPHIATGLWNEGLLTREHLMTAHGKYRGTTFQMELLGEPMTVSIQTGTYYMDYEFIVDGHPDGICRVRDIPDALAVVTQESVF